MFGRNCMNSDKPPLDKLESKKGVKHEFTQEEIFSRLSKIEGELPDLKKRLIEVEETKGNLAEFIFQAVSLIVGIVAIIFALTIGIPTYQKLSDAIDIELLRSLNMLNYILGFLVIVVSLNVIIQWLRWKKRK